ncbi:NAD(P)H-flavin reductase [Thalassocella blandensis]|nr:NAD(P)H-flavin reductase [Thalassocella blandensis]
MSADITTQTKSTITEATQALVNHPCRVLGVNPISAGTFEVELQSPAGTILNYHAGQYLQLDVDVNSDGQFQSLFYSIANGFNPDQPRRLQLYIQNTSEFADKILKYLSRLCEHKADVKVTMPMGQAFLQTDLELAHILAASGSGISQIKCLTEEILKRRPNADVSIYWSNKNIDDFYLLSEFQAWASQHQHLKFTPILAKANLASTKLATTNANWTGRTGYIYEVIEEDCKQLRNEDLNSTSQDPKPSKQEYLSSTQVYLCGSPQMVYGTIDKLASIGLKEENCYSDVFEYAPRD